jgi:hypothetical protein
LISELGRKLTKKSFSSCSMLTPAALARSARMRSVVSVRVGPGSSVLTVTPVPASATANPRAIESWAVLLMP